jgi:hypothetical protein
LFIPLQRGNLASQSFVGQLAYLNHGREGGLPADLNRAPFGFGSVQQGGGGSNLAGGGAPESIHPKPEREQMKPVKTLAPFRLAKSEAVAFPHRANAVKLDVIFPIANSV